MDDDRKSIVRSSVALGSSAIPKRRGLVLRALNELADVKDADYYFFKGEGCREEGDTRRAVEFYERALTLNADYEEALFFLGYCFLPDVEDRCQDTITLPVAERYARAERVFQRLIDLRTERHVLTREDYITFCNLGLARYHLRNLKQACLDFKKAIELNPDYDNAYLMTGVIHDELGEYRDAAMYYQQAIEINPENGEAYYNLGLAQHSLGLYEDAIRSFALALKHNPDDPDACYAMGSAQERAGCFHLALKYYQFFLAAYQGLPNQSERIVAYVEKRIRKMRELLTDLYYFNMGTKLWEKGDKESAMVCFEIAVELRHARDEEEIPPAINDVRPEQKINMRPVKGMDN